MCTVFFRPLAVLLRLSVIAVLVCLSACRQASSLSLLEQAETMIESRPDSALLLLESIDPLQLSDLGSARYGLLLTEANYKLYNPIASDSLVSSAVDYFRSSGDLPRLATSFYYKAVVIYELNRQAEAMVCLKEAEQLAEQLGDELLKNKVYDSMGMMNENAGLYDDAIRYTRLLKCSSESLNDSSLIVRSYNNLYYLYHKTRQADSAARYKDLLQDFIDKADDSCKVIYLTNLAYERAREGNLAEARTMIEQALQMKEMPNMLLFLGGLYQKEGNTEKAITHYLEAAKSNQGGFAAQAYHLLANLYISRNNYQQAFSCLQKADSLDKSIADQQRTTELAEIQKRYDQAVILQQLYKRTIWAMLSGVLLLILSIIAAFFLHRFRIKERNYKSEISKTVLELARYRSRIELLEKTEQGRMQERETMHKKIEQLSNATSEWIAKGKNVYDKVLSDHPHPILTNDDERSFVDYFILEHYERFSQLQSGYHSLTLRPTTYLILQELGLDDQKIMDVLNIAKGTIRTYRHRLAQAKIPQEQTAE